MDELLETPEFDIQEETSLEIEAGDLFVPEETISEEFVEAVDEAPEEIETDDLIIPEEFAPVAQPQQLSRAQERMLRR